MMPPRTSAGPLVSGAFAREFRFLQALWELDHALESASRRMKSRFGVTGRERLFIRIVGQRRGIAPREVAEVLHVHRSSVTAVLKRLERRRFVRRRLDAADARSHRLELTAAGERVNAMQEGTIEAVVRDALCSADRDAADAAASLLVGVAKRLLAEAGPRRTVRAARPKPRR
jgi:DNA-binding MarR family transcriptional regulator